MTRRSVQTAYVLGAVAALAAPPRQAQAPRLTVVGAGAGATCAGWVAAGRADPGLEVRMIESSCCGMSGAFGYAAENIEVSKAMGELSLLPAVRKAAASDLVVADGTSCRHQIHDGAGRDAIHVARVLEGALRGG